MVVLAVAVATALVWALWVVWVPLLPSNLYIHLLDLGKITGYTWASALTYLAMVLVLYAAYAIGYRRISQHGTSTLMIFGAAAIFCLELIWAYPATAADIFAYVADGQLLALHGANPFVIAPKAFPDDAILPFLAYPSEPAQYGPLWVLLGAGVTLLAKGQLLSQVLLYKVLAGVVHVASGIVVLRIAQRLTSNPFQAQASAFLFLWNPLLLWEMVGNGHNDGLMMLFGLIGVWLFVAGYDLFVLLAIAAGALVKLPLALIGPSLFIGLWRRSWARAVEGLLLALVLAAGVYRPFWEGLETFTALRRTDLFTASLASVLRLLTAPYLGIPDASTLARTVSLTLFVVLAVAALLMAITARTNAERLRPAYFTLFGAVLLLTTWFQAWYVVWPAALGAAMAERRRHVEIALLSLGGLLQYFVFIYLWVMGLFPPVENLGVQAVAYGCIIGPLLPALVFRVRRG